MFQGHVRVHQDVAVVVSSKLPQGEERLAEAAAGRSSTCAAAAAAKRWLQFLEPPELVVQGAVGRRDDGDVVPLEVRQIQSRRSDHREVYARREVLASGQHRRYER